MNRLWLLITLVTSIFLLATLRATDVKTLGRFYKTERVVKIDSFSKARTKVQNSEVELLELWESIMTGRVAPISKITKERYRILGLNHIFTPSGFHLSAVLNPVMKFIKNPRLQFAILLMTLLGIYCLPGMSALKRMVTIKAAQKMMGLHLGFVTALILDIFVGTFSQNTLSFTYSFLFLSIIYSGLDGLALIVWFFLAQSLIAYFQETHICLLLLVLSPLLNLIFGLIMPALFFLAFPLWDWQLRLGLSLLRCFQAVVDYCASLSAGGPNLEINCLTLVLGSCLLFSHKRIFIIGVLFFCNSLNLDYSRPPGFPSKEFFPNDNKIGIITKEGELRVKFSNGTCRLKLVRGFWWEICSPQRRSKKKIS
jgi:hypothetical protein